MVKTATQYLQWFLCGMFILMAGAEAQSPSAAREKLYVKPNKCIALHKGQVCYQKLRFKWQTDIDQEFCIFRQSDQKALVCWLGRDKTQHEYKFSGAEAETFVLRRKNSDENLAEVRIQVAWVYRKSKRSSSGWRLF